MFDLLWTHAGVIIADADCGVFIVGRVMLAMVVAVAFVSLINAEDTRPGRLNILTEVYTCQLFL